MAHKDSGCKTLSHLWAKAEEDWYALRLVREREASRDFMSMAAIKCWEERTRPSLAASAAGGASASVPQPPQLPPTVAQSAAVVGAGAGAGAGGAA